MSDRILFYREIEDYLMELKVFAEPYKDENTGITFLKLSDKNILLNINLIKQNAGKENYLITEYYSDLGLNLVQLWEDQWVRQKEIVKSRLRALAGKSVTIYGRETSVSKINNPVLIEFLKKNHLSIPLKGKYKYGLFRNSELVAVASFSYPRNITRDRVKLRSYELLRFCHLNDHLVIGGLTKLLTQFINDIKPNHLMTYIDREWGQGEGFEKAGFRITGQLPPKFFMVRKDTFERLYTAPKIDEESSPEYATIYNCGSIKMEKHLS